MSYQDELQRLEAENARLKDELIDVLRERNDLAAELAKYKPSWDDAPEWAQYCVTATRRAWYELDPRQQWSTTGVRLMHDKDDNELERRP